MRTCHTREINFTPNLISYNDINVPTVVIRVQSASYRLPSPVDIFHITRSAVECTAAYKKEILKSNIFVIHTLHLRHHIIHTYGTRQPKLGKNNK